jgi:uncharacterized membrane protein YeaQ/YmgE (transglycosylase-associated protein family)
LVPGRQNIALWLTMLIGVVAALLGTFVASGLNAANTDGGDWIDLALQVGFAALGVAAYGAITRNSAA